MTQRPLAATVVPCLALAAALFVSVTTVSAKSASPASDLHRRALALEDALKVQGAESIQSFLDPAGRGTPRSAQVLRAAITVFSRAAAAQVLWVEVKDGGRRGVTKHAVASSRYATSGLAGEIDFDWVRGLDGRWYVEDLSEGD